MLVRKQHADKEKIYGSSRHDKSSSLVGYSRCALKAIGEGRGKMMVRAIECAVGRKKRGRPVITTGLPKDFLTVHAPDSYKPGSHANNKMAARAFTRFLRVVVKRKVDFLGSDGSLIVDWREVTYDDFLEYALAIAECGSGYQVVVNYCANVRRYLIYKFILSQEVIWAKYINVDKERIKRFAGFQEVKSAPIVTLDRFRAMSRPTRKMFTLLLLLGLRSASLRAALDSDYVTINAQGAPGINISHFKVLPDEVDRVVRIPCACEGLVSNFCPIHTEGGLPALATADWSTMSYEMQKCAVTWHSAKRTSAVMLRWALETGAIAWHGTEICRFFGHSFNKRLRNPTAMFDRYSRGWQFFSVEQLPPLFAGLIRRYKDGSTTKPVVVVDTEVTEDLQLCDDD